MSDMPYVMNKNIKNYKDLKKAMKMLSCQVDSYEKSWYANFFIFFFRGKHIAYDHLSATKDGYSVVLQFFKNQFFTPAILFNSIKFLYRTAMKHPKLLFQIGLVFPFISACIRRKRGWKNNKSLKGVGRRLVSA